MDDRTHRQLIDQLAGDGGLFSGPVRLGDLTYAINVFEVRTSLGHSAVSGTEMQVRLLNHSINAGAYQGQLLMLQLHDGRQICGFISADGASLVRTGALT